MSDDPKTEQPSSSEPRVLYETRNEGSIAVITMNRPRYRNPLSSQMMAELDEAFIRAEDDPDVRVIILRGEGPTFSGGHDLGSPDALATRAERENEPMGNRYPRTRGMDVDPHLRWRDIPKPTIAVVQGACIYAAWMLASAMDVIFAAEDAQFLPTNFAYFAVPWDIGARRAKYLMFDNRFLTAREAMDWGFVQEVHPSEELEAAAMAYAERVAQQDPFQIRLMKHSIHQMQEIQGFTPHILSSFSDRMVRAANAAAITTDGATRREYISVERARANREQQS
ncbi:MAG: enoyl-CoA hydratase/isomerase family protein [Dehalococcoidia bacterium]|nr:enoyl-CoA hydratase/isomerase family protein [Dehalococcoidia bacterium]